MEWIKISTSIEMVRVSTDDIVFVQADGNYSDLYLYNGKPHKMTFKLKYFDEEFQRLKNNPFIRVGKSLIVNKKYIYIINIPSRSLVMSGGKLESEFRLTASRESLQELKEQMVKEG